MELMGVSVTPWWTPDSDLVEEPTILQSVTLGKLTLCVPQSKNGRKLSKTAHRIEGTV
jgi:hypothetical protein